MSPVTNSTASAAYIFKTDYAGSIGDTAMRMHPVFNAILKSSQAPGHEGDFVGIEFAYPMKFGNPQGISNTFTNSQAQASATRGVQFKAVAVTKYGTVLVDGPSILKCADDGAFADLVTLTTDDTIAAHVNALAFDFYRSKTAVRGKRASVTGNVIQLATIDDARNFEIDQTIVATDVTGATPRTGSTTVTGIDLSLGQVTVASVAAITGFIDTDLLYNAGDQNLSMDGMEDCTPLTPVSGADSFRGQNRSVYRERLSGWRLPVATSSAMTIEEAVGLSAIGVNTVGGTTTDAALNPLNFWSVVRRGNARVEMVQAGGELKYGFERAAISTPAGSIVLWSDPDCPVDRCRGFNRDSHYIRKNGELVHIINDDGNWSLRSVGADSIESRTRSLCQYIQNNTRDHFVFAI